MAAKLEVGWHRPYEALGFTLADGATIQTESALEGGKFLRVYLGAKPPLGGSAWKSDEYFIPGGQATVGQLAPHPASVYLSAAVLWLVEVDNAGEAALRSGDQATREAILQSARPHEEECLRILDAACGVIGLLVHRQLVLRPLAEGCFLLGPGEPVFSHAGPPLEALEGFTLNPQASNRIQAIGDAIAAIDGKHLGRLGTVLHWLLKAWRERDYIAKFVYLFIPLEAILPKGVPSPSAMKSIESISTMVAGTGLDGSAELIAFLEGVKAKYNSSLVDRFETLARGFGRPGWEVDVQAFKRFNRMRNLLVHTGDRKLNAHLNIKENTRTLEDLVERYIALSFFGTDEVYPSRWRPAREPAH